MGLPISQHGGSGAPAYSPPGFAIIITLAMEHSFFSGRSLSQLMVGGVFDRFPDLQIAFVETEAYWMGPVIKRLEQFTGMGSDWMGFARVDEPRRHHEPLAQGVLGVQLPRRTVALHRVDGSCRRPRTRPSESEFFTSPEFFVTGDKAMFGVDYPHFESILPSITTSLADLVAHPAVTDETARKVLFDNAAELYGFDLAVLQPHVERVGFEPGEVLASTST